MSLIDTHRDCSKVVDDQAIESNSNHFNDCIESSDNDDDIHVSCTKCSRPSYDSTIDDKAEEPKLPPP